LLKKNKNESARNSLDRIWGKNDQELINAEMERIQANVEFSEGMIAEAKLKGPLIVQAFQGTNKVCFRKHNHSFVGYPLN
jgi:hypothetical protein